MKLGQGLLGGALGMIGGLLVMFSVLGNPLEKGAKAAPQPAREVIVSVPIPAATGAG